MHLPADCPFARMADSQFGTEIDRADCCRAVGPYWPSGSGEPLCSSRSTESEAYRFFWRSSFDYGDSVVHIARKGDSIGLRCWDLSFGALEEAPTKALSLDDWKKLQQALEAADFWSLSSARELPVGFDGAQWLIEGRRGDIYHAIHRWSPRGAVRDIGRLFFDLAGPPLATIDLS